MLQRSPDHAPSPLVGIALACSGYSLFAIQDAVVKWLVADYAVPQILFMRSIMIVVIAGIMVRRLTRGRPATRSGPQPLVRTAARQSV